MELDPGYDEQTCAEFVVGLGDQVLERSLELFSLLADRNVVDSVALAAALGVAPRAISGHLTTPLKRRAKALKLPLPFGGGEGARTDSGLPEPPPGTNGSRTLWQDRDGVAARMLEAVKTELVTRRRQKTTQLSEGYAHTSNAALTESGTEAIAGATDDDIWAFANTFQGDTVFDRDRLQQLAADAIARWEEHRQIPRTLTLRRAVLFAMARRERVINYDAAARAENKRYMRTLARMISVAVQAGDVEDEYEAAVAWSGSTASEREELWEEVPVEDVGLGPAPQAEATVAPTSPVALRVLADRRLDLGRRLVIRPPED